MTERQVADERRTENVHRQQWYESTAAVFFALALLGPFGLPFVWRHPRYSRATKTWVTAVVLGVTILLCYLLVVVILMFIDYIGQMGI